MKLVIDIDKRYYEIIKHEVEAKHWDFFPFTLIANGTPLDSIIADIEQARAKDKLCEYPYVRCVEIIKKAMGHEEKTMDEGNK